MLKPNKTRRLRHVEAPFAIVASRYNSLYVNGLLKAAVAVLRGSGVVRLEIHRVPGAFEIPVVAAELARRVDQRPAAILCLGLIWQGETAHASHIGDAITRALMEIQVQTGVPCVHEVLSVCDSAQARVRCLVPETNRGTEAAQTALSMATLMAGLRRPAKRRPGAAGEER